MASKKRTGPASAGPCPHCGSTDTYECQYGHPGHDVIFGHEPRWRCRACERAWGRLDDQPGSPCYSPFWFGEPPRDDVEAAARLLVRYRHEGERFELDEAKFLQLCDRAEAVLARANEIEKEANMVTDAAEGWEAVEEKLDQAITEVMLTDGWREAPTLEILRSVIEHDAPLPARVQGKKLLELLDIPVEDMTDVQRNDLSDELVGLLRFVCHRGRDD